MRWPILNKRHALLAADMCGGAYACIDYTLDYLKTRKQFGGYQLLSSVETFHC